MPSDTPATTEGTHIRFDRRSNPGRKTLIWAVVPRDGSGEIGSVQWYSPWRKYCFIPLGNCVFEEVCMREISDFIVARTREHKEALKAA